MSQPTFMDNKVPSKPAPKVNYLTNKELLLEIHRSKTSFCEFLDPVYAQYDIIVFASEYTLKNKEFCTAEYLLSTIDDVKILEAKQNKINRLLKEDKTRKITVDDITTEELVFRVITYDHIPNDPDRKKNPKTLSESKKRIYFTPFKHYIKVDNSFKEVGQSHSLNGSFSNTKGRITPKLAKMFMLLVERYSQRPNWRGYTYLDEMKGSALLQLSTHGLLFNEHKSDNPFAYFTQFVILSFTRVLNTEKRNQDIRDDLLEEQGMAPSFSRQMDNTDFSQESHVND
jgi:hypothetical protein